VVKEGEGKDGENPKCAISSTMEDRKSTIAEEIDQTGSQGQSSKPRTDHDYFKIEQGTT